MRERWDELLSLLVAHCSHRDAAAWANEIEAAVKAKGAEITRLRGLLEATEAAMHIGAEHENVSHRRLCADVRKTIRAALQEPSQ